MVSSARALVPLLLSLGLGGCGYRMVHPGGNLPGGARAVCAPMMENLTPEPAAETWFTEALRGHLLRVGALASRGCESELVGTVLSISSTVGTLDARGQVTSYRARASLRLTLRKDGVDVRSVTVAASDDSLAGLDLLELEVAREAALYRLAEQLTRDAFEQLSAG